MPDPLLNPGRQRGRLRTSLHSLLGRHTANLKTSHWRYGQFVSACIECDREMVKLPGQEWRIAEAGGPDRNYRSGR